MNALTPQQLRATDSRISVWVTASAGSGKTTVLVNRLLRLMLEGVPLRRILCLTFTNAAASEMITRLQRDAYSLKQADDEKLTALLSTMFGKAPSPALMQQARGVFQQLVDDAEQMRIQTIHGFCQSLLRLFPLEAGTIPHFTLLDEAAAHTALYEAWQRLLRGEINADTVRQQDVFSALEQLSTSRSEQTILKQVQEVLSYTQQQGIMLEHTNLEQIESRYAAFFDIESTYNPTIAAQALLKIIDDASLEAIQQALFYEKTKDNFSAFVEWRQQPLEKKSEDMKIFTKIFLTQEGEKKKKPFASQALKDIPTLQQVQDILTPRVQAYHEKYKAYLQYRESYALYVLAFASRILYRDYKQTHAAMDYADLIAYCARMLDDQGIAPWVMYKLDGGIDHILVDEAQDTSRLQWSILQALCGEFFTAGSQSKNAPRSLFVVGDEKQSIYSFQGAAPDTMRQVQHQLSDYAKTQHTAIASVYLHDSFRALPALLRCVDSVFSDENLRCAISFEPKIEHHPSRSTPQGYVELQPFAAKEKNIQAEDATWHEPAAEDNNSVLQEIAQRITQRIDSLLRSRVILPSKNRAIEARDIMVLFPKRTALLKALTLSLQKAGIPCGGLDRIAPNDYQIVQDVLSAFQFLSMPSDNLALVTLLKSPLFSFNETALQALCKPKTPVLESLRHQYSETHIELSRALDKVDYVSPHQLLLFLLDGLQWRERLAHHYTISAQDILSYFISLTLHYSLEEHASLQGFIAWYQTLPETVKLQAYSESHHAVRIMTVHGSKGLQAPVVILPETALKIDMKKTLMLHPFTDDGSYIPVPRSSEEQRTPQQSRLNETEKQRAENENMRLLYVAMTRAEDALIVYGYGDDKRLDGTWYNAIQNGLEKLGSVATDGDVMHHGIFDFTISTVEKSIEMSCDTSSPSWLHESISEHTSITSRSVETYSPSAQRGVLLHKLLEVLSPAMPENHIDATTELLCRQARVEGAAHELSALVKQLFSNAEMQYIFTSHALNELPVYSKGALLRVDKVLLLDDAIEIIDFKSGTLNGKAMDKYTAQLQRYADALSPLYPHKNIRAKLLWIETAELQQVKISSLSSALLP